MSVITFIKIHLRFFIVPVFIIGLTLSPFSWAEGIITTLAGNGTAGFSGDNSAATAAQLQNPTNVALDQQGNLYIADRINSVIRKIDTTTGTITTIAGNATKGYTGDGGAATVAQLDWPEGVAVDNNGIVYIADTLNSVIRKVTTTGNISTFAGTNSSGYNGDNIPATVARLNQPLDIVVDSFGNLYIADSKNNRVRRINITDNTITSVVTVNLPTGVAIDSQNNLYVAAQGDNIIYRLSTTSPEPTTVVEGTVLGGTVYDVAVDSKDNVYVSLSGSHQVVRYAAGSVTPVAGTKDIGSYNGDDKPAEQATLNLPQGMIVDANGNLYIADTNNHRLRGIELNVILTVNKEGTGTGTIAAPAGMYTGINCDAKCTEATEAYPRNAKVESLVATASEDSKFTGWTGECESKESSIIVTVDVSKTCTAHFERIYTVQVQKENTGTVTSGEEVPLLNCGEICTVKYGHGETVTLTAQGETGVTYFTKWSGDCEGTTPSITLTIAADKSCTAHFSTLPKLTLTKAGKGTGTVTSSDESIVCGETCIKTFPVNTEVELTASPKEDSFFNGWGGDCSGTETATIVTLEAADKACTATFELLPILTVKVIGTGKVAITDPSGDSSCDADCPKSYAVGTEIKLTAQAPTGSLFKNWVGEGNCQGNTPAITLTMDKTDQTCTATFEVLPLLTVTKVGNGTITSEPTGISCGSSCEFTYPTGSTVTLTAAPAADSFLVGWSSGCTGSGATTTVTVNASASCTATFEFLEPPLTLQKVGNGTVTSSPAGINCGLDCPSAIGKFTNGTAVTLTAQDSDPEWKFASWGEACSGTTNSSVVTVNTTKTCTAKFKLAVPSVTLEVTGNGTVTSVPAALQCGTQGTACVQKYNSGETIQLTATPDEGFQLKEWGGNCSGTNITTSLLIDDPKTCTAIFEPLPPLPPDATSIQFSIANYTFNEADGEAILLVTRAASKQGQVSVDYIAEDGDALGGTDYQPTTGTLTWSDGVNVHQEIRVPLLQDGAAEGPKSFTVRLSRIQGIARLGQNTVAKVTIVDTPLAGSLQFAKDAYSASENDGKTTISVQRVGDNQGVISVTYLTQDETATAGSDYQSIQGTLNWTDGDAQSKTFDVIILADELEEGDETLKLKLANPNGGASIGAIGETTLTIVDAFGQPTTDTQPGVIQLVASNYHVAENGGEIIVEVARTQGSKGTVDVTFTTKDGTAKTGEDYLGIQGRLRWPDGDDTKKTISIGILDDTLREETETIVLTLSNPAGGAILGEPTEALISIEDDDTATLQFSARDYAIDEDGGLITIGVTRLGSIIGQLSVDYETKDLKTTSGMDYELVKGTLFWSSGDNEEKTFNITIFDDRDIEGNEDFEILLQKVTGNAQLGTPSTAKVTIVDNDSRGEECRLDQVIDCFLLNDKTLQDITITQYGTVAGGRLGGTIESEGVIQNVTLLPKTVVNGGLIRGNISSDPTNPAILTNVRIVPEASLEYVIVGRGSVVESGVVLGKGVCFEDNISVPSVANLAGILGRIPVPNLPIESVKLTGDVLCYPATGGIVGAINGLYELSSHNWKLKQNASNGYLELDVEGFHYAVLPIEVRQILRQQVEKFISWGMTIAPDKQVIFITHTGREIITYPAIQRTAALFAALQQKGLPQLLVQENGNLKVPAGNHYYSGRPSLFSTPVENKSLGFAEEESPYLAGFNTVVLIFSHDPLINPVATEEGTQNLRQQYFYSAAANPKALYGLSVKSTSLLHFDGRAEIYVDQGTTTQVYKGLFDYTVTPGTLPQDGQVQLNSTNDANGDGISDYVIIYPNGDRQRLFQLP